MLKNTILRSSSFFAKRFEVCRVFFPSCSFFIRKELFPADIIDREIAIGAAYFP